DYLYFSVALIYIMYKLFALFFFSSRRRHTRSKRDWSSDVCSSDLGCWVPFGGLDDCFHHISHVLYARQVCAIKHAVLVFNLLSGSLFVCSSSDLVDV